MFPRGFQLSGYLAIAAADNWLYQVRNILVAPGALVLLAVITAKTKCKHPPAPRDQLSQMIYDMTLVAISSEYKICHNFRAPLIRIGQKLQKTTAYLND